MPKEKSAESFILPNSTHVDVFTANEVASWLPGVNMKYWIDRPSHRKSCLPSIPLKMTSHLLDSSFDWDVLKRFESDYASYQRVSTGGNFDNQSLLSLDPVWKSRWRFFLLESCRWHSWEENDVPSNFMGSNLRSRFLQAFRKLPCFSCLSCPVLLCWLCCLKQIEPIRLKRAKITTYLSSI